MVVEVMMVVVVVQWQIECKEEGKVTAAADVVVIIVVQEMRRKVRRKRENSGKDCQKVKVREKLIMTIVNEKRMLKKLTGMDRFLM